MPESRHKYLFERLGDHDFQQLVAALLAGQYSNFTPLPLRQSDGGRDGLRQAEPGQVLIYQVKWSVKGQETNPVGWLDEVVRKEQDNLKRLAEEGIRRYVLVTNVASTGHPRPAPSTVSTRSSTSMPSGSGSRPCPARGGRLSTPGSTTLR